MSTDTRNILPRMLADTGFFFRRNLIPLIVLSFIILVPYIILINFMLAADGDGQENMALVMMVAFLGMAIQALHHGAEIRLFADSLEGVPWSLGRCVRAGFSSLPRLLPAFFIASLIVMFGFLAFILPGIYLAARFAFYGFYIVLEGAEPVSALKASLVASRPYVLALMGGMAIIGCPFLILASQFQPPGQDSESVGLFLILAVLFNLIFTTLISIFKFRCYCLSKEDMRAPFPDETH